MEMKRVHVFISSERRERRRVGEGENSREAGDDGGNHGYKDGGQTQEQEDKQEDKGLPAVGAAVWGWLQQLTLQRENSKVRRGRSSRINVHSTGKRSKDGSDGAPSLSAHSLPLLRCSSQYTDPSLSLRTSCPHLSILPLSVTPPSLPPFTHLFPNIHSDRRKTGPSLCLES